MLNNIGVMVIYWIERRFYDFAKWAQVKKTADTSRRIIDDDVLETFRKLDEINRDVAEY